MYVLRGFKKLKAILKLRMGAADMTSVLHPSPSAIPPEFRTLLVFLFAAIQMRFSESK
jgi:hypothetical protein